MLNQKRSRLVKGIFFFVAGLGGVIGLVIFFGAIIRGGSRLSLDMAIAVAVTAIITAILFMLLHLFDRLIISLLLFIKPSHTKQTRAYLLAGFNACCQLGIGYIFALLIQLFPLAYVIFSLFSLGYLSLYSVLAWKNILNLRSAVPIGYLIACMGFSAGLLYEPFAVPIFFTLLLIFIATYFHFKVLMANSLLVR